MRNIFKRKKKTNLTDVDINRNESTLYLIREYSNVINEDRTVAIYVNQKSAQIALKAIKKNRQISRGNTYTIETFNFVEHKNSLVGK